VRRPSSKTELERVKKYERVFARAEQWAYFTEQDVENNGIEEAITDPDFIKKFKETLSRKRGVDESVRYFDSFNDF